MPNPSPSAALLKFDVILRLAWQQYVARFDVILLVNLCVALPLLLLIDLTIPRELIRNTVIGSSADLLTLALDPSYIVNLAIQQLVSLALIYITVVIVLLLQRNYYRAPASFAELCQAALQLFPRALLAGVVMLLLTSLGFILGVIPGIILSVYWSMTIPALVWQRLSVGAALKRSWQLVRGRWWTVLVTLLSIYVLTDVVSWLVISLLPDTIGFTTAALTISNIIDSFASVCVVVLYTSLDSTAEKPQNT